MAEQQVLTAEHQAEILLSDMLTQAASFFPLTDADHEMLSYCGDSYRLRVAEQRGRNQITVARGASGKLYVGSHNEEEELEAKADCDLQFVSSWIDALLRASGRRPKPDRVVGVGTQRWSEDDPNRLVIIPPDSIARQQYIQFSPGSLFLVNLNGMPAKLPVECLYPWEYYSRPLPSVLEKQNTDWRYRAEITALIKQMILSVSGLFPLTTEDYGLINKAAGEIEAKFAYGFWQLASAFITEQGNTDVKLQDEDDEEPVGIQHDTKTGRANTDAEQAAIKKARRLFYKDLIKTIVTVHHATKNFGHGSKKVSLVSSCALCRKSLLRYSPNAKMLIPMNGEGIGKVPVRVLYPLPDFAVPPLALAA